MGREGTGVKMGVFERIKTRKSPLELNEFVEIGEDLYEHFVSINDKVAQEFIYTNLIVLRHLSFNPEKLFLEPIAQDKQLEFVNKCQQLSARRMQFILLIQFVFSLIVSVFAYFVLVNQFKFSWWLGSLISLAILFLFMFSYLYFNEKNQNAFTQDFFDKKVDKALFEFYKFYLS